MSEVCSRLGSWAMRAGPWRRIVMVGVAGALMSACSSLPAGRHPGAHGTTTTTAAPTTTTTTVPTTTTTTDPGLLPQTPTEPPVDASLESRLEALWAAIYTGSATEAPGEFFPESAYLQMKTGVLPNPAADYTDRLVAFYTLDLAAYHAALGADGAQAGLIDVEANPSYATWIPPGACENLIGYWHLPNVRLVYEENGKEQSFAVASLISWRGVWYVVHLGPNPRPVDVGTVDQPATGPGTPGPPGGC